MKITYSSGNIKSFGGINFADHIVGNTSVYKTIDQTLGGRGVKAEYSYNDLIRSNKVKSATRKQALNEKYQI